MIDPRVQGLIAQWQRVTTHQAKARIERKLWPLLPAAGAKTNTLAALLGDPAMRIRARHEIDREGLLDLWIEVDAGRVPLFTAWSVIRRARSRGRTEGISVARSVAEWVQARRAAAGVPGAEARAGAAEVEVEAGAEAQDPRQFWRSIRDQVAHYMRATYGLDPMRHRAVLDRVTAELQTACESAIQWARLQQQSSNGEEAAARSRVSAACRVLSIDPPRKGKLPDLRRARRQKQRLALAYHPDTNAGSEATRSQYQAVIEAYAILEAYVATVRAQTQKGESP